METDYVCSPMEPGQSGTTTMREWVAEVTASGEVVEGEGMTAPGVPPPP